VADRYRVNQPTVIHQTIDGETVIIHLERGLYYSLDEIGAEVWQGVAAGRSASEVAARLGTRYPSQQADVDAAVVALVDRLQAEELIVRADVRPPTNGQTADERAETGGPLDGPFRPPRLERFEDLQDLLLLDPIHAVDETGWPERLET
jgi:hypothetical protein